MGRAEQRAGEPAAILAGCCEETFSSSQCAMVDFFEVAAEICEGKYSTLLDILNLFVSNNKRRLKKLNISSILEIGT